jgi:NosR/NirI family nitrous oxide reductase transcriptional regulator
MNRMSRPPGKAVSLTVIESDRRRKSRLKPWLLRLYRLGVVLTIVFIIHHQHARLMVDGDAPIKLDEIKPFFAGAARLETDESPRKALFVLDGRGQRLGYVVRTSPVSDKITGYAGPTDTLIAMDIDFRVIGVRIRSSWDTKVHVRDVANDAYFMKTWNGKAWDEVAGLEPRAAGIEGVSGASLTSMAIAEGIHHRFRQAKEFATAKPPPLRLRMHDWALLAVIALAIGFAFTGHWRGHKWLRRAFQVVLIGYVGFWNGQMLAQSLLGGWAASGVAWRIAPALALLLGAALIVPWTSRRALYCSQICPHGAAQELLGRLTRRKLHVPKSFEASLRWVPALLLLFALTVTIWNLPFDLAGIEPFDAYLIRTARAATITIAVVGLIAALFVPMAYCKYGCPTGAVLAFLRSHGRADRFGRRDALAGLLLLAALGLYGTYGAIHNWIME